MYMHTMHSITITIDPIGNYDRQTDQSANRPTDRRERERERESKYLCEKNSWSFISHVHTFTLYINAFSGKKLLVG